MAAKMKVKMRVINTMIQMITMNRMFSTSSHLKSTTLNFLITLWHKEKRLKEANHGWKPLKIQWLWEDTLMSSKPDVGWIFSHLFSVKHALKTKRKEKMPGFDLLKMSSKGVFMLIHVVLCFKNINTT